jgi:tetratricopeptide (TPR) repeat protein
MSLFKKIFGSDQSGEEKTSGPSLDVTPAKPTAIADPSKDPNLIRVYDSYGRELFITKDQWRKNVLPGSLKANWNNPDQLYGVILGALNDGLRADVIAAAEQLFKIDTQPERGSCVWGIVLKEEGRLDEAEQVFLDFIAKHGENGSVLTNLAKVYSRRKDEKKAEEILWHAMEVDPNQDNGLAWYCAIYRERGGEAVWLEAMHRVAALPGSWRAKLWLARTALQSKQLEQAFAYYRECLAHVGNPAPTDLLMQMSGDLGNAGHLPELLHFTEPNFVVEIHGLQVGNNLIKAHLDLGQIEDARRILNQLYSLNRMDWKQTLSFWDTEIAKAKVASKQIDTNTLNISMLTVEGPVWLKSDSPAASLFPIKASDAMLVSFLGSSAEGGNKAKVSTLQMADAPGRMSRALPLFFAEQVTFGSKARVQTLVPWIANAEGAFVVSGVAWSDEAAAKYSRQSQPPSAYIVTIHLKTQEEQWSVELRLIRAVDGVCLGTLNAAFPSDKPQEAIPGLAQQLLEMLGQYAQIELQNDPKNYEVPLIEQFPYYLLRLEQLMATRCSSMDNAPSCFLSGERDIIDGNIQLCLACKDNVGTRILLARTVLAMKKVRPDILPEYKDKLNRLQTENPLPQSVHQVVQQMFDEVFAA